MSLGLTIEEQILSTGHDSLATEDVQALKSLAESCPYLEGPGVYRARKLLAYFEPATFYDDKEICSDLGSNRYGEEVKVADEYAYEREGVNNSAQPQVRLLQNPVHEQLSLIFSPEFSGSVDVEITDLLGRVLIKYSGEQNGTLSLVTSSLSNGPYLIAIKGLNSFNTTLKFVKQ